MHNSSLVPDYSKSVEEVYAAVAKEIISNSDDYTELLGSAGLARIFGISPCTSLSTWIPRWDTLSGDLSIDTFTMRRFYAAIGLDSRLAHLSPTQCDTAGLLRIPGIEMYLITQFEPQYELTSASAELGRFCRTYSAVDNTESGLYKMSPLLKIFSLLTLEALTIVRNVDWALSFDNKPHTYYPRELPSRLSPSWVEFCLSCIGPEDQNLPLDNLGRKNVFELDAYVDTGDRLVVTPKDWDKACRKLQHAAPGEESAWAADVKEKLRHLRIFHTKGGYLGMTYPEAMPGDVVCVVEKCHVPLVLRPAGSRFKLVGPCFVVGLMKGEAAELWKKNLIVQKYLFIE
jgi:hypothetical protein